MIMIGPAHRQAEGHELDRLTVQGRGQSRAGLTVQGSRSRAHGLTRAAALYGAD